MSASVLAGPGELLPGDVVGVEAAARECAELAVAAAWTAELLSSVQVGGWVGEAAEAFVATAAVLPVPFEVAAAVFGAASAALADYAQELGAGRVQAGRAAALFADGERASERWRQDRLTFALGGVSASGPLVPALRDPGEDVRAEAGRVLAAVRERVEVAGDRAARVLRDGCTEAARTRLSGFDAFAQGALDSVVGTGRLLWELSVPAMLVDRDDAVAARTGLVTGVAQAVAHPREAVAGEVARWRQDPAYAAGGALPDVLLSLLTAGGAGAAARAGRVSAAGPVPGSLVTAVVRPVPDSGWTSFVGYRWRLVAAQADDARRIADHAFAKHVLGSENPAWPGTEFPGVRTRQELADYIERMIEHPDTEKVEAMDSRQVYWEPSTGTMIVRQVEHDGAIYKPREGYAAFDRQRRRIEGALSGGVELP